MSDVKVVIGAGEVVLRKPKAGERNKALIMAEDKDGVRMTKFMVNLIPFMVKSHPFGAMPVEKALDELSTDDYDLIVDAVKGFLKIDGDVEKKSD